MGYDERMSIEEEIREGKRQLKARPICANCHFGSVTWTESRRAYARMIAGGVPEAEVKKRSPSHYKCAGTTVREFEAGLLPFQNPGMYKP